MREKFKAQFTRANILMAEWSAAYRSGGTRVTWRASRVNFTACSAAAELYNVMPINVMSNFIH